MPICHKKKLIFIHIPKNAGESIEKTLGIYGGVPLESFWGVVNNNIVLQHATASELKRLINNSELWSNYFKFAVVRNPWSKAVSEFNWYLRYFPKCHFKSWLLSLPDRIKNNHTLNYLEVGHNIPQSSFLYDKNNKLMVDKILKFENIKNEFNNLSKVMRWNVVLEKTTTTASSSKILFKNYYDLESISIVEKIYKEDIKNFSYSRFDTFGF